MKLLLIVATAGIGGYLLFRLLVYLGRPLYLQNAFKEIDEQYTRLLRLAERDLESAIERHNDCTPENSPFPQRRKSNSSWSTAPGGREITSARSMTSS